LNKGSNISYISLCHENVLLYKLQDKTYITMKYVYKHKTVSFNTNFVSKIIDYGNNQNNKIVLASMDPTMDENDDKRGFVLKEEVLELNLQYVIINDFIFQYVIPIIVPKTHNTGGMKQFLHQVLP
jgi:hypothetical protein